MTAWQTCTDLFQPASLFLSLCSSVIQVFLAAISRTNCSLAYQRMEAALLSRECFALFINPSVSLMIKEDMADGHMRILEIAGSSEV